MSVATNKQSFGDENRPKISLKWLLTIVFVFQSIGIVGLTGWFAFRNSQSFTNRLISEIQAETAHHIEHEIDRFLATASTLNELTIKTIQFEQLNLNDIQSLDNSYWNYITTFDSVRGMVAGNTKGEMTIFFRQSEKEESVYYQEYNNPTQAGQYTGLKLNAQREVVESVTSDRQLDAREQTWYKAGIGATEPVWTPIYPSVAHSNTGSLLMSFACPVFDQQNKLSGVVGVMLDIAQIDQFLQSHEISPSMVAYILQPDGTLVSSSEGRTHRYTTSDEVDIKEPPGAVETPLMQASTAYLKQRFDNNLANIRRAQQFQLMVEGERQFLRVQPISDRRGLNWLVAVAVPEADFMAQTLNSNHNLLYLCMSVLGFSTVLGVLISHWLALPINRLSKAAARLSPGQFDRQIATRYGGIKEVDVLTRSLSVMERDLQQSFEALQASEHRFRRAIADAPFPMMIHAEDGEVLEINDAWTEVTGYTHEDIPTMQIWTHRAYGDSGQRVLEDLISKLYEIDTRFNEGEFTVTTKSGSQRIWKFSSAPLAFRKGRRVVISMAADITERYQIEAALRESQERLRLVTENINDLVCLHAPDGCYLYVTPSSRELLGYNPEELIGKDPYNLFHPDDSERVRQESHQQSLQGLPTAITYRIRQKSGAYIWLETLTQPICNEEGGVIHLQTTSRDVSDRVEAEEQLRHDALHDRLTELPNRSLLMARLDLALKRAKRHPENRFAVLFLDLDHFKVINDSLGHLVGDELLLSISRRLIQLTRQVDLVARLGGDEFVILIEEVKDTPEVIWVAERILTVMKNSVAVGDREVFVDASIGIVFSDLEHHRPEDLLRDADLAMYRAKHRGRSQYALFEPTMRSQIVDRLHLEHDLRQAIDNGELVLHYQPIRHLNTKRLKGFEALVRWQHPEKGLISPGEFIEVAEEMGLIVSIGQWVLNAACEQLLTWQRQFPGRTINVSVNLSVQQLQEDLLKVLKKVPAISLLGSNSLTLEITESMLIENVESTQALLNGVREMGIHLSIDDFGTGYSCLSYLHQLPVDALKIDRAFVSPEVPDARNRAIAESIIALTNQLGLDAIAEGIETPQQLEWLENLGCEFGQGLLFAPAYSAAEATELLIREKISLR